uniref:Uncharacterized protein n=1 Tax=Ditylenchus dipsaci TaxID=166011 RepID=A0A915EAV0_9BILA
MLRRNLRSPTMMHLQNSIGNLNVLSAGNDIEASESLSRPMTPSKPFNCRITQNYRSLNLKKDTERQHRILEQLAKVRAQLKDRQEKIERSFSNQNLANAT